MLYKIGTRVTVTFHRGTVVAIDDEFREKFPALKNRELEFTCVRFDGKGPYGNGMGVFHQGSLVIRKLRPEEEKSNGMDTGKSS